MAWFDLQINGYGGVDFNQDDLKDVDLHQACAMMKSHGLRGILAAIISDSIECMVGRIRRIILLRGKDPLVREMIWGIHVEGPFLNPQDGYRGAHPLQAMQPAQTALAARLLEAGEGLVRLFTLAPEQDSHAEVIKFLVKEKVVVSAGHTNATLDELQRAIDAGLSMFTHLGNGCPQVMHRHDNIVQRALALRKDLWLCFIADGVHLPLFVLGNYFDTIGLRGKIVVTTDAMAAAGLGEGQYRLGSWDIKVGDDLAARSPDGSHLVGSAVPMPTLIENLRKHLRLSEPTLLRLADANARSALGLTLERVA